MKSNVWLGGCSCYQRPVYEYLFQRIISTSEPRRATVILILFIGCLHQLANSRFSTNFSDWQECLPAILCSLRRRTAFPTQQKGVHLTFKGLCHPSNTFPYLPESSRPLNAVCSPAATASHWSGWKCTGYFPFQQADS